MLKVFSHSGRKLRMTALSLGNVDVPEYKKKSLSRPRWHAHIRGRSQTKFTEKLGRRSKNVTFIK